jgi:hypothetical protein
VVNSEQDAYQNWLETNRLLHRANLRFAAGVSEGLPEHRLLTLARQVGQLQEDESTLLQSLCALRANRPDRLPNFWRSVAKDRVRVSTSSPDVVLGG